MATLPDSHLDLLTRPGIGVLSTITPEGEVQSTAIWYLLDDGQVKISVSSARKKLRNLQHDPHANLFILDPANPFRFIEVRGTVTLAPDSDFGFRDQVGRHYDTDMAAFDGPGAVRYVVTLHPTRVNAQ